MRFPCILTQFTLGQVFSLRIKDVSKRKVDNGYVENMFPVLFLVVVVYFSDFYTFPYLLSFAISVLIVFGFALVNIY